MLRLGLILGETMAWLEYINFGFLSRKVGINVDKAAVFSRLNDHEILFRSSSGSGLELLHASNLDLTPGFCFSFVQFQSSSVDPPKRCQGDSLDTFDVFTLWNV
jgi:hypothetical protein